MAGGRFSIGTLVAALELEDRLSSCFASATRSITSLGNSVNNLGGSVVNLGNTVAKSGVQITRFGDQLTLLTAPLTAATLASAKMAVGFERDMAKLVTLA